MDGCFILQRLTISNLYLSHYINSLELFISIPIVRKGYRRHPSKRWKIKNGIVARVHTHFKGHMVIFKYRPTSGRGFMSSWTIQLMRPAHLSRCNDQRQSQRLNDEGKTLLGLLLNDGPSRNAHCHSWVSLWWPVAAKTLVNFVDRNICTRSLQYVPHPGGYAATLFQNIEPQ